MTEYVYRKIIQNSVMDTFFFVIEKSTYKVYILYR